MNDILVELGEAKEIAIAGHVRPDGDCIGSCLALYQYLTKECPERSIDVYLESMTETFSFIKGTEQIKSNYEQEKVYDLFIALDCGDLKRLGLAETLFVNAKRTINIDHHISNENFANVNHVVPQASSTCEVLFSLFEESKINKDIATALYVGMIHDTGIFKHSNTSKETMRIAGILMDQGIAYSNIIDESFYQKTYLQNQILGRCLLESIMVLQGKCIISCASKKVMEFYGAEASDLDGIIDQMRVTKGVEVAILLHEINNQKYKVSMRSNNLVNVSKIAQYFGGGGHIKAAGCTMEGSYYDVINNLTQHIELQLKENNLC